MRERQRGTEGWRFTININVYSTKNETYREGGDGELSRISLAYEHNENNVLGKVFTASCFTVEKIYEKDETLRIQLDDDDIMQCQ